MKKGFSLIELIICISLISIIAVSMIFINVYKNKNDLDEITEDILDIAYVFIEKEKDTNGDSYANGINNGGQGVIIPLNEFYDKGYIDENKYQYLVKNVDKKYQYILMSFKTEEECSVGTSITIPWEDKTVDTTTYICPNTEIIPERKSLNETIISNNKITESDDINEKQTIFATIEDNYGTSYYFGGDVSNNYIDFAGMCWRILRIDGHGNVKLILEDKTTTCENADRNDGLNAFVQNEECIDNQCKYALSGLRYLNDGTIIYPLLVEWFDNNIKNKTINISENQISYADFVITSDYCSDNSIALKNSSNEYVSNFKNSRFTHFSNHTYMYTDSSGVEQSEKFTYKTKAFETPFLVSLKCDFPSWTSTYPAKSLNLKVSLITADELVLATDFKQYKKSSSAYYLFANSYLSIINKGWWTMTLEMSGVSNSLTRNARYITAHFREHTRKIFSDNREKNEGMVANPISYANAWNYNGETSDYNYARPVITLDGNLYVSGKGVKDDAYKPIFNINYNLDK